MKDDYRADDGEIESLRLIIEDVPEDEYDSDSFATTRRTTGTTVLTASAASPGTRRHMEEE